MHPNPVHGLIIVELCLAEGISLLVSRSTIVVHGRDDQGVGMALKNNSIQRLALIFPSDNGAVLVR